MARFGTSPHDSLTGCNGNLLCAIDVETTGLDAQKHDVIQLAILPLDSQIKPLKTVMPFYVEMVPKRPENIDKQAATVHNCDMVQIIKRGVDPWIAVDLFEEWFARLNLPIGKRIMPLAHNWPFDREFVREWIGGPVSFEAFFHHQYRDSMASALYLNDRAEYHSERIPVPKVSLSYCCTVFGVTNAKAHDALSDCVTTAEIYRRLLGCYMPKVPPQGTTDYVI